MVQNCCVVHCSNRADSKIFSFHNFPARDHDRLNTWIALIRKKNGSEWFPTKFDKVCSAHFLEVDFFNFKGLKKAELRPDAVPSVFPICSKRELIKSSKRESAKKGRHDLCDSSNKPQSQPERDNVHGCFVAGCSNRFVRGGEITFHRFPKDELMKRKWTVAVCRKFVDHEKTWTRSKHARVCSDHFREDDFHKRSVNRLLKPRAVPSLRLLKSEIEDDAHNQSSSCNTRPRRSFWKTHMCAALGCESEWLVLSMEQESPIEITQDVALHRFPKQPSMFWKWRKAVGIKQTVPLKGDFICSHHFRPEDFSYDEKKCVKTLKLGAVPSVFEIPSHDLLSMVEPSAPYLQPSVLLRRCDEAEVVIESDTMSMQTCETDSRVAPSSEVISAKDCESGSVAMVRKVNMIAEDHAYSRDLEKYVKQMEKVVEDIKNDILSIGYKVKSINMSVSALKTQYIQELETLHTS